MTRVYPQQESHLQRTQVTGQAEAGARSETNPRKPTLSGHGNRVLSGHESSRPCGLQGWGEQRAWRYLQNTPLESVPQFHTIGMKREKPWAVVSPEPLVEGRLEYRGERPGHGDRHLDIRFCHLVPVTLG